MVSPIGLKGKTRAIGIYTMSRLDYAQRYDYD